MTITANIIATNLILLLLVLLAAILLEVFLSRLESRIPGLILPGLTLLYSLFVTLGMVVYLNYTPGEFFLTILSTLLLTNVPTLVLLAIYFACRRKFHRRKQFDKMNIQDLE